MIGLLGLGCLYGVRGTCIGIELGVFCCFLERVTSSGR